MLDKQYSLLIDGQLVPTGKSFPVIHPATEEVLAEVPEVDAASVQLCLTSSFRFAEPLLCALPEYLTLKRVSVLFNP